MIIGENLCNTIRRFENKLLYHPLTLLKLVSTGESFSKFIQNRMRLVEIRIRGFPDPRQVFL